MLDRLAADAGWHAHKEIARRLKRPGVFHSVIGDILANANERVRKDLAYRSLYGRRSPLDGYLRYPCVS